MRPDFLQTLRFVGLLLEQPVADYCFAGRFRFQLGGDWSLVVSSDFAGRTRLDACYLSVRRSSFWCRAGDRSRLKDLVLSASHEVSTLV